MPSLVKVGTYWLNLDRLQWVHDDVEDESLYLVFNGASADQEATVILKDVSRRAMIKHLDAAHTITIGSNLSEDREYATYSSRGGRLVRSSWNERRDILRGMVARMERLQPGEELNRAIQDAADLEHELLL